MLTIFLVCAVFTFIVYNIKMSIVSANAYEELTSFATGLMDDDSISIEDKKAIRSQVMFIGMPGMKYLLLLLSPFAGLAIRPVKKAPKKEKFNQKTEFDRLYGNAVLSAGPIVVITAVLIALFSMFFIYGLVMLVWAVSMFTNNVPNANASMQVKAPVKFERLVEYVSHRAFSLS